MDLRNPLHTSHLRQQFNSQSPPFQFETQQHSDFYQPTQQHQMNPQHSMINQQHSFNFQYPPTHIPYQASSLQPPTIQKSKKASVQKERNPNWSKEEDEALCKAWLRISHDAAIGTEQSRNKLWERILDEFNRILGNPSKRISSSLTNRWSSIQAQLNKYSGFLRTVENSPTSGYNVEDSIGAAKQLYYDSQGQHFKLDGCWLILKDSSKWFHYTKEQLEKKEKIKLNKKRSFIDDVDLNDDSSHPQSPITTPSPTSVPSSLEEEKSARPMGKKMAKNQKKNSKQLLAVNLFVEEFSNLRKDQKEISEREIQAKQEQERLKLEAKLRQEQMKIAARKEKEQMKIAAKRDHEQRKLEKEIMLTDPNSIPTEAGRAWVIAQQKTIWARMQRGVGDGSSDSEEHEV